MIKIPYGNTFRCWNDLKRRWEKCPASPPAGTGARGTEPKPVFTPCQNQVSNPANNDLSTSTMVNLGVYPLNLGLVLRVTEWMALPLFNYYREECCEAEEYIVTWTDSSNGIGSVSIAFANGFPLVVGANPFEIIIAFNNVDATGLLNIKISGAGCGEVTVGVLYDIQTP